MNLGIISFLLVLLGGPIAIGMALQWRARERMICRTLKKREDPKRIESLLPLLDRCVDRLVAEYGLDTFAGAQLASLPAAIGNRRDYVLQLLALAAEKWQVTLPPVHISAVPHAERGRFAGTFVDTPAYWSLEANTEGDIAPSQESGWSICIDPKYLHDDLALVAIVAHEFAHGILHRDRVSFGDPGDDEILTDVAAALIGFGQFMLQLQSRVERRFALKGQLAYSIGGPGYLWPPDLTHILWRHGLLRSNAAV